MSESRQEGKTQARRRIDRIAGHAIWALPVILVLLAASVVTARFGPWPRVANEAALIQASADWLAACKEAKANDQPEPPMPPEIARLDGGYMQFDKTYAAEDYVYIHVGSADPLDCSVDAPEPVQGHSAAIVMYGYLVFPDETNIVLEPLRAHYHKIEPTRHPQIFKVTDYMILSH